ncbi:MAG: imidazole glycerol phosphate synthase subunit HisH [Prevotellaceae bacterium]|nr:imidazole glycerol phosphate synthase subunit HisH [Prevotellaceae bacterium]
MGVAIVKYNAGNIYSVLHALRRLGVEPSLTDDPESLRRADKVLFPGQGEAGHVMAYLQSHHLDEVMRSLTQPVLGICIGQQLLCRHSEEGDVECLGVFDVPVRRFIPKERAQKVPHMGWNDIHPCGSKLFEGIVASEYVYFVHSYYVPVCPWTIAKADYIHPFSAALQKENFYATQFHPEKSGSVGERILRNFLAL